MLYIGYFQSIKKISFGNFHFLSCRGWKTASCISRLCPSPLGTTTPPPPPPPNTRIG